MTLSVGAIIGITLSVLGIVALFVAFFLWNRFNKNQPELALDHAFVPQSATTAAFYPIESAALSASGQPIPEDWFAPISPAASGMPGAIASASVVGSPGPKSAYSVASSAGYPSTPASLMGKGFSASSYTIKQVASGGTITSIRSPLPRLIGDPLSAYPMSATSITKATSGMPSGMLSSTDVVTSPPRPMASLAPTSPRNELDDPFASPQDPG